MSSQKSKYALKAAIALARGFGRRSILIADIAQHERISRKFLELIRSNCAIKSFCRAARVKAAVTSWRANLIRSRSDQILRVVEGPVAPIPCVSLRCRECRDENTCGIRMVMKQVRDATAGILDATSLADVLDYVARSVKPKLVLTYEI
jgi:Rrf2 family protein